MCLEVCYDVQECEEDDFYAWICVVTYHCSPFKAWVSLRAFNIAWSARQEIPREDWRLATQVWEVLVSSAERA